ncbi:hypothetical protein [Isosphaera pallida]|uniref:hypothetical protein n=1 Tax=Isosphaera pallida TaxID=128 RepID=UPI0011D20E32|nr:hypothetical protein [Isosphaera pallida]
MAMLSLGCSEEWAEERPPTTWLEGRALVAGVPLTRGWVELSPVPGTVGTFRSGRIGSDGRFRVDGLTVGRHSARIVHPPAGVMIPPVAYQLGSPLVVEVRAPGPNRMDLDFFGLTARPWGDSEP